MANNYEQIMALVNAGNKMGLSNTITRDNGIPLDLSSVYSSYDAAVVYAATKAIAYHGQPIAVITEEAATLYIITPVAQGTKEIDGVTYDVYLKEVGSKTLGDDKSITLSAEGVLSLYGFDAASTATLPQKQEDGTLRWVPIDAIVEGDTNTKSVVVSDNEFIEVTSARDETTDTVTYTLSFKIDISNYYTKEEVGNLLTAALSSAQEYTDTEVAAAQDEVDALEAYVGTFTASEGVDTVVKYIDAKTANIASNDTVDALADRVEQAENDIDAIEAVANTALQSVKLGSIELTKDKNEVTATDLAVELAENGEGELLSGWYNDSNTGDWYNIGWGSCEEAPDGKKHGIVVGERNEDGTLTGSASTYISNGYIRVTGNHDGEYLEITDEYISNKIGDGEAHTYAFPEASGALALTSDIATAVAAEATARETAVAGVQSAVDTEKARAEGIEAGLRTDVDAIKGDYLKAADKEALQTQINTILNNPDTEGVINSINEFTQYIADHGEIAEGFRTDIDANKKAIEDHEALTAQTYETKEDATTKYNEVKAEIAAIPQDDWNQNDPAAADYIKNRTHYVDASYDVVCEGLTVEASDDVVIADYMELYHTGSVIDKTRILELMANGEEDDEFLLTVNGVEYKIGWSGLGVYGSKYEGLPVVILGGEQVYGTEPNTTYTISLKRINETIKQLDEKFIPDTIARVSDVDEIADKVATLEGEMDAVEAAVATKAEQTDLSGVRDELGALEASIGYAATDDRTFAEVIDDTFAKKTEVESAVATKAEQTYVDEQIDELADKVITKEGFDEAVYNSAKDTFLTTYGKSSYRSIFWDRPDVYADSFAELIIGDREGIEATDYDIPYLSLSDYGVHIGTLKSDFTQYTNGGILRKAPNKEEKFDIMLPEASGTLALTSDIETSVAAEESRATNAEAELATAIETAKKEATNQCAVVLAESQEYTDAAQQAAQDYADSLATNYADAEHDHVVADITDFDSKVDAKVNALANGQVETNKQDIAAVIGRISAVETASGKNTADIAAHAGRLTALEGADVTISNNIGTLQGEVTALKQEDARLAGLIDTKANAADVYNKTQADAAIKSAVDASAALINAEVAKKADTETVNAELAKKADADKVYTKTEADAAFMTQEEVDGRIAQLINAADPEGGKVISDLQKLVQYVDENAGDIEELVVAVGHNTDRLAGIANDSTVVKYVQDQIDAIVMPKASEEVTLAEDGTLGIGQVNVNKLVQTTGDVLILDGGNATA